MCVGVRACVYVYVCDRYTHTCTSINTYMYINKAYMYIKLLIYPLAMANKSDRSGREKAAYAVMATMHKANVVLV